MAVAGEPASPSTKLVKTFFDKLQPAIVFAGFFTKKGRRCICLQNRYDKYTRTCYNRKRASGLIGSVRKAKKLEAVISNPGDKTPHEALEYGKFLIITSFQC